MPSRMSVESFVSLVELGKYDLAIELYYARNARLQEDPDPHRIGVGAMAKGESRRTTHHSRIEARRAGPYFIEGDNVVIRWIFEFTDGRGGRRRLEELAYQRWQGEHIAEERFYYDPAQMRA